MPSSRASGPSWAAAISAIAAVGLRPEAAPTASRSSASGRAPISRRARRRAWRSSHASGARKPAAGKPDRDQQREPAGRGRREHQAERDGPERAESLGGEHRADVQPLGHSRAREPARDPETDGCAGQRPRALGAERIEQLRREAAPARIDALAAARAERRDTRATRLPPAARSFDDAAEAADREEADQLEGRRRAPA